MDFDDISQEWVKQNEHLKEMSASIQQISFSFEKMERSLSTEFKILSYMTETKQHVNKLYKNPQQYNLNRYSTYLTFQTTRVKLDSSPQDETVQNYINANFVSVQGKKVIATQGPLTSSFQNFWKMVDLYQVKKIFMLCNFIEKKIPKCQRYFPHPQHNGGIMFLNQYQLKIVHEQVHSSFEKIKVRQIELKNNTSKTTKIITQYQVTDWQDGRSPRDCQGINWLLSQFLEDISENRVPVVHCSAGVGRTGTFIAMGLLKLQIDTNQDLSVFEVVRRLRQQRWGMVKNLTQYEYLYEFAEERIMNLQTGMTSLSEGSDEETEKEI